MEFHFRLRVGTLIGVSKKHGGMVVKVSKVWLSFGINSQDPSNNM